MPKQYGKLRKNLELFSVSSVFWLLSRFPLRWSMGIGRSFGILVGKFLSKLNRIAYRNLQIAFPNTSDKEKKAIIRGTFASLGRHLGFISHFRFFGRKDAKKLVDVVGEEHYFKARETGRGLIFFTGHFGSWEIFNLLSPAFDEHINILVRRIDNELVENYVDSMRTRFGSVTLGKRRAPRRIYELLEKGEVVGILADLNAQLHDGVFVDYFGVPACTTTSIAKFALRSESLIMPAFAVWNEEKGQYEVHIEPPIEYETSGVAKQDILEITSRFTEIVEKYVRKYPDQWLWIHKRWNTRPKGEKGLY